MHGLRLKNILACLISLLLMTASQNIAAIVWNDGVGGATRDYHNSAAKLPWDKKLGDWIDVDGKRWGTQPFAKQFIKQGGSNKLAFDVKELVISWQQKKYKNNGFMLRGMQGGGVKLYSKEYGEKPNRPYLSIETNKEKYILPVISDTFLAPSTSKSLGAKNSLSVSGSQPALIIFDLKRLKNNEQIKTAKLYVTVKKVYGKSSKIGVYRVHPNPNSSSQTPVTKGVADKYPLDSNISSDSSVYFATSFENYGWEADWKDAGKMGEPISSDTSNKFTPFLGKAMSSTIPKGKRMGLNQRLRFKDIGEVEPDRAYFRYYIRLANNWDQTVTQGKLPGFAGTYNRAGWGSRKPNGTNGWSARGHFLKTVRANNKRLNPIGSYVYHIDQHGYYGSAWTWSKGEGGLLKNNRWYCIEQFVQLNDPDQKNGELKAWVDGKLVFEQKGLRFRLSSELKIEEVWFNIYHGGTANSPKDQTVYIDNFVLSKKYIGPVKRP